MRKSPELPVDQSECTGIKKQVPRKWFPGRIHNLVVEAIFIGALAAGGCQASSPNTLKPPIYSPAQPTAEPTIPPATDPELTAFPTIEPVKPPVVSTATAEISVTKKQDLFIDYVLPNIYKEALKRRAEMDKQDPQRLERVNAKLNEGRVNVLITGGRKEDTLTDSIHMISLNTEDDTLHMLTIPRDVRSPEVERETKDPRNSRINQALGIGGPELLKESVENATGLYVDFYINTKFDVIEAYVDKFGPIEVELNHSITDNYYPTDDFGYKPIHYPTGINMLNGEQALEVARSRKDPENGSDYERSRIQQEIIIALAKKILTGNFTTQANNIKTADEIWYQEIVNSNLTADFDINQLMLDQLLFLIGQTPRILWDNTFRGGVEIITMPVIKKATISDKNLIEDAGIPNIAITKVKGSDPNSPNYWEPTREFTEKFLSNIKEK